MIDTGLTTSAKLLMLEFLAKESMKLALYTGEADIGPTTDTYTTTGEVTGKGYKPGGIPLKGGRVWEDRGSACLTWDSPTINVSTISANGFLIYIPNRGNRAIFTGSWSATYTSTEGPFTVNIAADQICID